MGIMFGYLGTLPPDRVAIGRAKGAFRWGGFSTLYNFEQQ
jgi:hypothetical protein